MKIVNNDMQHTFLFYHLYLLDELSEINKFGEGSKKFIIDLLNGKKCSELTLINKIEKSKNILFFSLLRLILNN